MALGFAAGFWAATQASEQTRAQVDDFVDRARGNPRVQRVTDTVTRDARRLGDTVGERVRAARSRSSETATEQVEPYPPVTTASPGTVTTTDVGGV